MKMSDSYLSRYAKPLFTALFPVMLCSSAEAQERSMDDVMQIACQHFMQEGVTRGVQNLEVVPSSSLLSLSDNQETFYLCTSKGAGFVLVSADEQMPRILGYSDTELHSADELPASLLSVLQGYTQLRNSFELTRGSQFAKPEVRPLLKTQWDQADPYNRNCPDHSVAGCVATAAAQIMRYYEQPKKYGVGTIDYVTDTKKMRVYIDLSDYSFAWDLMLDTYKPGAFSNAQAAAVSKLIYAVGAACQMDFGRSDSGASLITCALGLNKYFGYDKDMYMLYGDCVSADQWNDLLVKEINESRPVLFSGVSERTRYGHAFVLDGYKSQQNELFYHVNWGWNGKGDGYYLINKLNPEDDGTDMGMGSFDSGQLMLLNFQPDDGIDNPVLAAVNQISLSKTAFEVGEKIMFDVYFNLLICMQLQDFAGTMVFEVVDADGKVVKEIEKENFLLSADDVSQGKLTNFQLPSLAIGQYTLRAYLKKSRGKKIEMITNEPWPTFEIGDSQSSITELPLRKTADSVVDLFGRAKKNADKQTLPAGFYVIDGKKTLVK